MTTYATTFGTGPFRPALIYKGQMFVLVSNKTFDKEDDAVAAAQLVLDCIDKFAQVAIKNLGFKPEDMICTTA
jgi:hypothetical protein